MTLLDLNRVRTAREERQAVERSSADRRHRRGRWWIGLACGVLWAVGTTMTWYSLAATGADLPGIVLYLGLVIGNVGPFLVLMFWMVEADRRGK